jgi:hypothetical protein
MNTDSKYFAAAAIARAAALTRQAVHTGLSSVPSSGQLAVAGKLASAWRFSDLPLDWQMEITRRGVMRGFENGEHFLSQLPGPWKPPLPWAQVSKHQQEKAVKLQQALSRALELRTDGAAAAQVEQAGRDDFKAQFGYTISGRHWRRLLHRTLERDAGEENWHRLEIYLDERAVVTSTPKREVVRKEYVHRELDQVISTLESREHPTGEDRKFLWDAAFHHYEQLAKEIPDSPKGERERRLLKSSLVRYLFSAFPGGILCANECSLRRRFDEKLDQWRGGGCTPEALEDRRATASGNFRKPDFSEDEKKIRDLAIQLDGNKALAHRMLRERGELSQEYCAYYPYDPRADKSAVPATTSQAIGSEVEMCLPIRRGPWQARMRGPYIPRDWSGVKPGDWFCADDVTWNHYFKERLADGRWQVLRGECLLMTDLRTGYPLDFLLIPGRYNGEHVRSLALKVHDQVGLPRRGFYFERGVWASRLVTGDRRQGTPVHWRDAENGLCSAGLSLGVRHATTPRAKPIEGLFHILQDRMRCIPGFVGFNERTEEFERVQALIARAHRGDPAALANFPTITEWKTTIGAVLEEFAHEPQNGEMLEGRSPAEAWTAEIRHHPLKQLPAEARYVLSTHQKRVTVRQQGIVLTIRGKRLVYYNEHTGPLIGREVLAFYNIEMPELLTVCDMNRQNYFSVRRVELPAMDATSEQLAEVNRLRSAHMAHAKGIFGGLHHQIVSTVSRDNEQSEESKDLGRFHNAEVEKAREEKSATTRTLRKIQRKAADAQIPLSANIRNPERVLTGIERAKEYREKIARKARTINPEKEPAHE